MEVRRLRKLNNVESSLGKDDLRKRRNSLIKIGVVMLLAFIVWVFSSIAWFSMNKNTESSGMGVRVQASPFELKTTGETGLYDSFFGDIITGYGSGSITSGSSSGIKWKLTKNTSEINNHYDGEDTANLREITRHDSSDYGLKPGDSGTLKFTIVPNVSGQLNIKLKLSVTGYEATYELENGIYYKTDDPLIEVNDATINHFLSSHILFFYKDTNNQKHIISSEGFNVSVSAETEITIYWVWPATLKEILDEEIEDLDDNGASKEVKRLFFENPDYFLKKIGNESFSGFTVAHNADSSVEDAAIAEAIVSVSGRNYSEYGSKYNDADQNIGNSVNYILVDLVANLDNEV